MSMPNIPNVTPQVTVTRDDAVNIILSSIGMEELGLAHLLNAEAEKVQFALGTLETANGEAASLDNILKVNKAAGKMVRDVIKNQMLLTMKMEDTVDFAIESMVTTVEPVVQETKEEAVAEKEATAQEEVAQEEPERTSAQVDEV